MLSNYVVSYDGDRTKGKNFFYTEQEALKFVDEIKDYTYIVYNIKKKKILSCRIDTTYTSYEYFAHMHKELLKLS